MSNSESPDRGLRFLVGIIAVILVIAALRAAVSLVVPLFLAAFAAVVAAPAVDRLERKGVPTWLAVLLVVLGMVLLIAGMGLLIGTSLGDFSAKVPQYRAQLTERLQGANELLGDRLDTSLNSTLDKIDPGKAMGLAASLLNSVSGALGNTFMIVFVMILVLLDFSTFPERLRAAIPDSKATLAYLETVAQSMQRYMVIKVGISLVTGIVVTLFVWILGLDFPVLWGLLAFLLNFIPTIGSILAAVPAVLMALIQFGPGKALIVAAGYVVVNIVMGNLIEPQVTGKGLGLSTLVVFVSLVFWGWVLGPVGMLLSVPLTMTIKIALQSRPDTRWAAVLMDSAVPEPQK